MTERTDWESLWRCIFDRHPTITEPGAKLAASVALDWMAEKFAAPKIISDKTSIAIISEVYKAAERLGGDPGLLACIGSWGDTLDDSDVLSMIKSWNEMGEPFIPEVVAR